MNYKNLNKILMPLTMFLIAASIILLFQQPIQSQTLIGEEEPSEEDVTLDDYTAPDPDDCDSDDECCSSFDCSSFCCQEDYTCGPEPVCQIDEQCSDDNSCTSNTCSVSVGDIWGDCSAIVRFPDIAEEPEYRCVGDAPDCTFLEGNNDPKICPTTATSCSCPEGFIVREGTSSCDADTNLIGTLSCQPDSTNQCGSSPSNYDIDCDIGSNAATGQCICCEDFKELFGVCDTPIEEISTCGAECINQALQDGTSCIIAGASGSCQSGDCLVSDYVSLPSRLLWVIYESVELE